MSTRSLLRFVFEDVLSNMYILIDGARALVVDPHPAPAALHQLKESNISDCTILLTHEHPDHTSGIYLLQQNFQTTILCHEACARAIASLDNNHPAIVAAMLRVQDSRNGTNTAEHFLQNYEEHVYQADITFNKNFEWQWGQEFFTFIPTPGHTAGSCCIMWGHHSLFSGDSLLLDMPTLTRLPGGSTKQYRSVTLPFLKSLDKNIRILPGHGPSFRMDDFYQRTARIEFTGA